MIRPSKLNCCIDYQIVLLPQVKESQDENKKTVFWQWYNQNCFQRIYRWLFCCTLYSTTLVDYNIVVYQLSVKNKLSISI